MTGGTLGEKMESVEGEGLSPSSSFSFVSPTERPEPAALVWRVPGEQGRPGRTVVPVPQERPPRARVGPEAREVGVGRADLRRPKVVWGLRSLGSQSRSGRAEREPLLKRSLAVRGPVWA